MLLSNLYFISKLFCSMVSTWVWNLFRPALFWQYSSRFGNITFCNIYSLKRLFLWSSTLESFFLIFCRNHRTIKHSCKLVTFRIISYPASNHAWTVKARYIWDKNHRLTFSTVNHQYYPTQRWLTSWGTVSSRQGVYLHFLGHDRVLGWISIFSSSICLKTFYFLLLSLQLRVGLGGNLSDPACR